MRKIRSQKGGLGNIILVWFLIPKGTPENVKKRFSHYICCKLRDLAGQEHWSRMEIQMASKGIQIEAFGVQYLIFWDFDGFCGKFVFLMDLGSGKNIPKNRTNQNFGGFGANFGAKAQRLEIQVAPFRSGFVILAWLQHSLVWHTWHRPVSDFGTHWILKGSRESMNRQKMRKIMSKSGLKVKRGSRLILVVM